MSTFLHIAQVTFNKKSLHRASKYLLYLPSVNKLASRNGTMEKANLSIQKNRCIKNNKVNTLVVDLDPGRIWKSLPDPDPVPVRMLPLVR